MTARERMIADLSRKAGEAGYCNIPALVEYMEAAYWEGVRAERAEAVSLFGDPDYEDQEIYHWSEVREIIEVHRFYGEPEYQNV